MAIPSRTYTMPGIWALDASTTIPQPPVPGISYRDAALTANIVQTGQRYSFLYDSGVHNQFMYQTSGLLYDVEQYGIPRYSPLTQYGMRGLALYTDEKIYRVKEGVLPPKGTPCTDENYWEEYVPDTTGKLPPTTAGSGFSMYVDYRKTVSGNGTTEAESFKNITDCLDSLRTFYSAVNGFFESSGAQISRVPTFNLIINGDPNTPSEQLGYLQVNNIYINFVINIQNFNLRARGFFFTGGSCTLSGTGSLVIPDGIFHMEQGQCFVNIPLTVNAKTVPGAAGSCIYLQSSRWDISANVNCDTTGIGCIGAQCSTFIANGGTTINLVKRNAGSQNTMSFYCSLASLSGTLICDTTDAGSLTFDAGSSNVSFPAGSLTAANISLHGGTSFICYGAMRIGSALVTQPQGLYCRFAYCEVTGALSSYGTPPTRKGVIASNGIVFAPGKAEASWPGGTEWGKTQGGAYYSS